MFYETQSLSPRSRGHALLSEQKLGTHAAVAEFDKALGLICRYVLKYISSCCRPDEMGTHDSRACRVRMVRIIPGRLAFLCSRGSSTLGLEEIGLKSQHLSMACTSSRRTYHHGSRRALAAEVERQRSYRLRRTGREICRAVEWLARARRAGANVAGHIVLRW